MIVTVDGERLALPDGITYYGQLRQHVRLPPQATLWDYTDTQPRVCPDLTHIRDGAVLKSCHTTLVEEPI